MQLFFDTIYDLTIYTVVRERSIHNVNVVQLNLIIYLIHGYNKNDFFDEKCSMKKSIYFKNEAINKAKEMFYDSKTIFE